jgi:hypothetical protein
MGPRRSAFEWRNDRKPSDQAFERLLDAPYNLTSPRAFVTTSAKREVYKNGTPGRAEILSAPSESSLSDIQENVGRFRVRVEIPGQPPYETKVVQSLGLGRYEVDVFKQGAIVECRVHPKNKQRVLLLAPEPEQYPDAEILALEAAQRRSAAATVAAGKPAIGTVRSAQLSDMPAPPGSDGKIYTITMELRAEGERRPWDVTIHQRVPTGAEALISPGSQLKVGYARRKSNRDVAIDWPGSTDGRCS